MPKTFDRVLLVSLILCCISTLGCNSRSHDTQRSETPDQKTMATSAAIALDDERRGIMSSKDFLHWEQISNQVSRDRRMDDTDSDWAVSMMSKPSTDPASVHMDMTGLFLTCRTLTPEQRQKIRQAVTPLLSSPNKYDRKTAQVVLKRIPG